MKAWLLPGFSGTSSMELSTSVEAPIPADGEVVIQLQYAALNPADYYLADKQYPAKPRFPHILGRDGSGTISALGPGATRFAVGDRVTILRGDAGVNTPGTLAGLVAVPEDRLAPAPSDWSMAEAAAAPLTYLTAWQALTCWGPVPAESFVLITGASGGVGVAAIQLARALDLRPIALSRGDSKVPALLELGAEKVFDPSDPKLAEKVLAATGPRAVSLAIDNVGGELFNTLLGVLSDRGAVSCVGRLAGPVPEFNTARIFFKRLRIGGVSVGAYSPGEAQECWGRIVKLLGGKRPVIDRVFPFGEVPQAFTRLRQGPLGKVVIAID
ncbi:zinc-binding dehydrogenase [bacterium]|nr:zinc-binding dehydrogenase [bacterium]